MPVRKRIPNLNHVKKQSPIHKKNVKEYDYMLTFRLILTTTLISLILYTSYVIYSVDSPINAQYMRISSPPKLIGPLKVNSELSKAERLFENKIRGPETIIFHKGHMYTGTSDGKVIDIYEGNIKIIAQLGKQPCGTPELEQTCGRPLSLKIYEDKIYILDPYLGLFTFSLINGDVKKLFSGDLEVGGLRSKFLNSLDISRDGIIYISDSSTRWIPNRFLYIIMEMESTGRLIKYDINTNTSEVLIKDLFFANGVLLSKDESYVLVAETTNYRILKYYLKGEKINKVETFVENLPGPPDNLKHSSHGGIWVCSSLPRMRGNWSIMNLLAPYPAIRNNIFKIFSIPTLMKFIKTTSSVIYEIDDDGSVIRSFWDITEKRLEGISEATEHRGHLYIGSVHANCIGKFTLPTSHH